MRASSITSHPIHLGLGASAEVEPLFTGSMDWYAGYADRHAGDGTEGRLVSMHAFTTSWDVWEMHPRGSEVVLCTAGSMRVLQERADGHVETITLGPGQYAINAPRIWHTADIDESATALFITAGMDTQHRPR